MYVSSFRPKILSWHCLLVNVLGEMSVSKMSEVEMLAPTLKMLIEATDIRPLILWE